MHELDTPCLLVYLDALENNYRIVADMYADTVVKMRQHTKNIKSPLLAEMQFRAGGTLNGVCTAKLSEAEVMVEHGIDDVLVANQIVTRDKISRLCALNRRADVKVCVDNVDNVRDISLEAESIRVTVGVLIEVDTSMGRAGVRSLEQAVELARVAWDMPGVQFLGVMSHQSISDYMGEESRKSGYQKYIQSCLDAKNAIEAVGIPVQVVSTGETASYDIAAETPGVTEVEGGTYALGGLMYSYMKEFRVANKVLSTVISKPSPGVVIGDVGSRALSMLNSELPEVEGMPGVTVDSLLEDHIILHTDGTNPLEVGTKFVLLPYYQDMMVNRWDKYVAVRNGLVEAVWDIPARGCTH